MEQTIKWVKGDRPEKEGWYFVLGKKIKNGELLNCVSINYLSAIDHLFYQRDKMVIEYHAEIIGPNGEKYE